MKVGLYTGSFNPYHAGHGDIITKALQVFDKVIVARGINPSKEKSKFPMPNLSHLGNVEVVEFTGLLVEFIEKKDITAIIRGLRNTTDLEYEKSNQYYNEDLNIGIPTVYFISDRSLCHMSSTNERYLAQYIEELMKEIPWKHFYY